MKIITAVAVATLACSPSALLAEGKDHKDWAEEAARGYEYKAKEAEKAGMPRAAAIYTRMAEIKREAGRAGKAGKEFSWDEYHELEGKLNAIKKEHHHKHKDHANKEHKKERPGAGFVRAAEEYRKQAHQAREHGDTAKADIFNKLADHKLAAAKAAQDGKGYDWSEYHELRKKLGGGEHKAHDKPEHKEHKKDWAHKEHDKPQDKPAGGKLNIE